MMQYSTVLVIENSLFTINTIQTILTVQTTPLTCVAPTDVTYGHVEGKLGEYAHFACPPALDSCTMAPSSPLATSMVDPPV
jgi:hypothetical protein